jgi:hypothetical protein
MYHLIVFGAGDELANIVNCRYGYIDYEYGIAGASTDFVSIVYLSSDSFNWC